MMVTPAVRCSCCKVPTFTATYKGAVAAHAISTGDLTKTKVPA